MEHEKRKIYYSVIRYSPDCLKSEVINVGLIFFDSVEKEVKFFMLDDKSSKIKTIMSNEVEQEIYKSYRDTVEYYLKKSKEDISGVVGDVYVSSYFENDFLDKIIQYYSCKELKFSNKYTALTKDKEKLFETILNRYVGEKNVNIEKAESMTVKKYMKSIFRENANLKKRVKSDVALRPIKELEDLEIKIDFTFRNGKWNYMQTISNNHNKPSDWFTKVQFILDQTIESESQVHLLYKYSEFKEDKSTYHLLEYLKKRYSTLELHDVDKQADVKKLCDYIEREGQILEDVV